MCLFALLVLIGASLPSLSFEGDIHRVFLSDSPLSQAQRAYEAAQSPPISTVLIHVTAQAAMTADDLTALRNLALDLEFADGVLGVASPFVLRWPLTEVAPNGTPVFARDISPDFPADIARFEALGTGLPTFLNSDLNTMLLSVTLNTDIRSVVDALPALRVETMRALPTHLSAEITGEEVISAEIVAGLKDDLIALNLWGALIVTLAAFALLRDLRMALLAVVPAILGAAGVLALSVWLGYKITVLSNVIPILLLVLGVANGVHLAGHLKAGVTLRATLTLVGPACALSALTTAVAFASIMLSGNVQLFEFAVLGALGTLFSFVILLISFTLLGRVMPLSQTGIPPVTARIAKGLVVLGAARPRVTMALCLAVLGGAGIGFSQTNAWFPLYQNLPDDSAVLATSDAIAADFGGVFQMVIETTGPWAQQRAIVRALEALDPPPKVLSEVHIARWLGTPDVRPEPRDLEALPSILTSQLRAPDGVARLFVSLPEPMRSAQTLTRFDLIHDTAMQAGATRVIGLPVIMRQEAVRLIDQLSLSLFIATLGASVLVAFAFRSARMIGVLIIPNVLPLMLTAASLHLWAAGQLTPTAVLALTIAFGIAIDDTVHFLNRFHHARGQGEHAAQAVHTAAGGAGQVMVLSTLLLSAGLCVTMFSDFTPIRLFGGLMIVTLWAALLIDLLLLPALLTWKGRTHASD